MHRLSLDAASGGTSWLQPAGFSLRWLLLLWSAGSRACSCVAQLCSSVVVVHGLSCSVVSGILPDQGSNLCPLHWQADSYPLHPQGSPAGSFLPKKQLWRDQETHPNPGLTPGLALPRLTRRPCNQECFWVACVLSHFSCV